MIPPESIRVSRCPAPQDKGDVVTIEWCVQIPPGGGDPWCSWGSTDHLHHRAVSKLVRWKDYRDSPAMSWGWAYTLHETTRPYAPEGMEESCVFVSWLHPRYLKSHIEPGWYAKLDDHVIPVVEDDRCWGVATLLCARAGGVVRHICA